MRIAYADESDRDGRLYFIGVLVCDLNAIQHIQESFDRLGLVVADATLGFDPATEFHAYDIFQNAGAWEGVGAALRAKVSVLALKAIANSGASFVFQGVSSSALRRQSDLAVPIHEFALTLALEAVDELLEGDHGDHGIVVADEHHAAEDSRRRFRSMRLGPQGGHDGRQLSQLVDTIYFGPSKHSRLLQAADMASYFANRLLTFTDEAPAAAPSMRKIAKQLQRLTRRQAVWE